MTEPSAREHLLDVAERHFTRHGLTGVRLRDLAQDAGLHHATLYHHAPGGKTQLYAEVMARALRRHEVNLTARLAQHQGDLRAQLLAVAQWVLMNPAGNHTRMLTTDLPRLPPAEAERLAGLAYRGLIGPVASALSAAARRGEAALPAGRAEVVAGGLLAALQALQAAHERYPGPHAALDEAATFIDVLLHGLAPRGATPGG